MPCLPVLLSPYRARSIERNPFSSVYELTGNGRPLYPQHRQNQYLG